MSDDSLEDAERLVRYARGVPSKVNIIEYNPIAEAAFIGARPKTIDRFADHLLQKGMSVSVRRSRGGDIGAACGQLANKK